MAVDRVRERVENGEIAYGLITQWRDSDLVEAAAAYGFDFVLIDAEHGSIDVSSCADLIRSADCGGISSFVRVPFGDVRGAYRFLDAGANGLVFPHIKSRVDAETAAGACLFPPMGLRGAQSSSRAARYGATWSADEFRRIANDSVWVIPIIEDMEGVGSLDAILSVTGIRAVFIGPADLALSRIIRPEGADGRPLEEIIEAIIAKATHQGKVVATVASSHAEAKSLVQRGVRVIMIGVLPLLRGAWGDFLGSVPRRPDR